MQQQQQQPEEELSAAETAVTASLTRPRSFHRRIPSLTSSHQTTDISKHYAVNNQILAAFQSLYSQQPVHYQVAYAMGLQFVETALLEIPKHGYYYSTRHETDRMQSALEAVRVTQLLQEMQEQDAHDRNNNNNNRVQKLATLALEQVEQASHDQYDSHRAETEDCLRRSLHDNDVWSVCTDPLLACDSLSSMLFGVSGGVTDTTVDTTVALPNNNVPAVSNVPGGSLAPIIGKSTTRDLLLDDDDDSFNQSVSTVPSTLPLKRASFMSLSEEMALEKALYLSGLEAVMADSVLDLDMDEYQQQQEQEQQQQRVQPSPTPRSPSITPHAARRQSMRIELQVLARLYAEDFDSLVQSRRVRVSFINTYQGRLPASTNGCTVIAPVLCMHHLLNDDDINMDTMDNGVHGHIDHDIIQSHGQSLRPDPGLPDVTIIHVIDAETPAILSELRQQLRLSPAAFLIPSDVHDYLIGNGQLAQEQFVTVTGGNILDDEHLQSFVDILACNNHSADNSKSESKDDGNGNGNGSGNSDKIDPRRKLAATLFFHEHVVAILKLRRDDDTVWYDVIDSLPSRETLARPDESEHDFRNRLSLNHSLQDDSSTIDDAFIPKTARIRCLNAEALKACLRWYACSKFGEENVSYIDMYAWDDAQSDFDPRVFQAFVWGDAREVSKIRDTKTSNTREDEDRFAEF
jgi:hypothetical protein